MPHPMSITTTQSLSLRALLKDGVRRAGLADRVARVYGVTPPVLALASAAHGGGRTPARRAHRP